MSTENDPPYIVQNGHCYVLLEPDRYARETSNLKLIIGLARAKIEALRQEQSAFGEESEEYDRLQEAINDHELLISDSEDRFELLLRIPSEIWSQ
jgi:hypothetical protein